MREDDELQDDDEQRGDSVREPSPPTPRKRTSDHGVETQKDKGTEPDGSKHRHGKRRRLAMDAVEIPVIVRRDKANGKAREDKGKGKGKEVEDSQHDVDMENESVLSCLFTLPAIFSKCTNADCTILTSYIPPFDPSANLYKAGPSNTQRSLSPVAALPGNTQAMMSSQVTLVATQPQARSTARVARDQTRGAEVRAHASSARAGGSGAAQKVDSSRVSGVIPPAATRQPEDRVQFRITRARSRSMEPSAQERLVKNAGRGKGRVKKSMLDPVTEDRSTVKERADEETDQLLHDDEGAEQTFGRPVGETNNEEEEVDQLLDEEQSGTVDVVHDQVVNLFDADADQEPEDDAQVRKALQNPSEGKTADEEEEDDEDESESESEDDLARLQKRGTITTQPQSNPRPIPAHSTARRYKPSSQVKLLTSPSASNSKQRPKGHNPLLGNRSPTAVGAPSRSRPAGMEAVLLAGTRARPDRVRMDRTYEPPEGTRVGAHKAKLA